jgi:hypothetical protein
VREPALVTSMMTLKCPMPGTPGVTRSEECPAAHKGVEEDPAEAVGTPRIWTEAEVAQRAETTATAKAERPLGMCQPLPMACQWTPSVVCQSPRPYAQIHPYVGLRNVMLP